MLPVQNVVAAEFPSWGLHFTPVGFACNVSWLWARDLVLTRGASEQSSLVKAYTAQSVLLDSDFINEHKLLLDSKLKLQTCTRDACELLTATAPESQELT